MKIAMVSEHASPLAPIGGVDAGGQNVHVAALSTALAARGHEVVVYTRADRPGLPRRVEMSPGVLVHHVPAGPAASVPKDELLPFMVAFADHLAESWRSDRPDLVHAHFWMSGFAAVRAAVTCDLPVLQTFHALGTVKQRWQADGRHQPVRAYPDRGRAGRQPWTGSSPPAATRSPNSGPWELPTTGSTSSRAASTRSCSPVRPVADGTGRSPPGCSCWVAWYPRKGVDDAIRALTMVRRRRSDHRRRTGRRRTRSGPGSGAAQRVGGAVRRRSTGSASSDASATTGCRR